MEKAIIVDHLSYSNELKDVSFTIQKGEMVGIVGSLNSGKSTILKIISGLVKPTSGFVSILGYDPFLKSAEFLKQMTFITQKRRQLFEGLEPIKILEITKEIYDMPNREFNKNLADMTQYIKDPILIDNLIYKPKILLIDEPDSELELIYQYNSKNESTTLFTTEKIDKLINLVRRIIIIDKGQIIYDGAIDEIISKFAKDKIISATLSSTIDISTVNEIGTVKNYVYPHLRVSCPRDVASLAAAELVQNLPIASLKIEEMYIEEVTTNMKL